MFNEIKIKIPYRNGSLVFSIPKKNLAEILSPQNIKPLRNLEKKMKKILTNPIGCPPLLEMVHPKDRILILIDDNTRLTPVNKLLLPLFEEFKKKGIPDHQIQILIALGTHRPLSREEMKVKVGKVILGRVKVMNHNWKNNAELVDLGVTGNGTPIKVNRVSLEADFLIGIGSIIPHHIAGYSGGSKIIQPGICGVETTTRTHLLSTWTPSGNFLGQLDNPVRRELDEIAERVGLKFIINAVLTPEGKIADIVSGEPKEAFRKGAELSKKIYGVPFDHFSEIVIANSYPCDLDFWQAHKSLYPAERIVSKDGIIICIGSCPEGISSQHPSLTKFASLSANEIETKYFKKEIEDGVAASLAIAWAKVREKATIIMVTPGIPIDQQKALGFIPASSLKHALDMALKIKGAESKISILTHAPETLPLMQ